MPNSNVTETIFRRIMRRARELEDQLPPEAFQIIGLWNTEYAVQLRPNESTPLHLKHVCVETTFIGSCYYEIHEQPPVVEENLMGRHVETSLMARYWRLAAYDAVYGNIIRAADDQHQLSGSPAEKALKRATIVCDEVRRLAAELLEVQPTVKIVNVGVVGDFLLQLGREERFDVRATDFYDAIVDRQVHGVQVYEGHQNTTPFVRDADIALVTGMTLANGTMEEIVAAAVDNDTRLVFFAETGSNFAEVYLELGAAAVVAESYPFYLSGSDTCNVRVYRR